MKRLFKKILIPASMSLVILPIASCNNKRKDDFKTIEITSDIDDVIIMQDQEHLSKPIEAKCFGSDKTERELDIQFRLNVLGSEELPEWISLTNKNEIKINKTKNVGSYTFSVLAYNEQEKIYSTSKNFKVSIIQQRHILPDELTLEVENNKYCMYGEETSLPIKVIPHKEGVEEKELIKSCDFKIQVIKGKEFDLKNNNLFTFSDSNIDPDLQISKDSDETYTMEYKLLITATLIDKPSIFVSKEITLNIDNIYSYYDPMTKYTYTRGNSDVNWSLSLLDPSTRGISNVKTFIQNKPVTSIGKNLCFKSNIKRMICIDLPDTINYIGDSAFENQIYLCSIKMPGVKYVGTRAFNNDVMLELSNSGEKPSLVAVGNSAFYNCNKFNLDNLQNISLIDDFAFKNAGLHQFEIGENCFFLGQECFARCDQMTSFKIHTTNPPILGGGNFINCDLLKTIQVPYDALQLYQYDSSWNSLGKQIEGI